MNYLRRTGLAIAGAILASIILTSAVAAGFCPRVEVDTRSDGTASVNVNSRTAIRFTVSNGGLEPKSRAEITAERINTLVAASALLSDINTKPNGQRSWVVWGDTNICVVTSGDAKANNTTAEKLASLWASRLRQLLSMPPIDLSSREIVVPVAETRKVEVSGAATGPITTMDGIPEVATSQVSQTDRAVVIKGKIEGDSAVHVNCDGESATLIVHVRKYAGRLKPGTAVEVTGNPAPGRIMEELAILAVQSNIEVESGANAKLGEPKLPQNALAEGKTMTVQVPVKINGGGHIPVSFSAPIEVVNYKLQKQAPGELFYSNNPESVKKFQTLFVGDIKPKEPTRLLYHHQNVMGKRFRFNLELINPTDSTAKMHIIGAMAEPIVDTVLVGYFAGSRFMKDYLENVGYIVNIPPNSKYIVYSDDVDPMKTASGILEFRELNGVQTSLRVGADIPQLAYHRNGAIVALDNSERDLPESDDIYPTATKEVQSEYKVGDRWAFIPIGKNAIKEETKGSCFTATTE
jgi:hypothetical protein